MSSQQASAGGAGPVVGRGFGGPGGPPGEQVQVKVPNNKVLTSSLFSFGDLGNFKSFMRSS